MNKDYRTLIKPDTMPYLSNVRQCYSLRKAQRDYTGDIGIIKRMSDGLVLNVGFNSDYELDTDLVDAFDDGSDLRMIEWHAQGFVNFRRSRLFNTDDLECPLLKRNGNYFYLNGKKTLYFEDGCWLYSDKNRDLAVDYNNCGIVFAGTDDQLMMQAGLSLTSSISNRIFYTNNQTRANVRSGSTVFTKTHSAIIPFNQQLIAQSHSSRDNNEISINVNGITETDYYNGGVDANNYTTINKSKKESYIQEVYRTISRPNFRPDLVEEANKYYNTF